MNQSQSISDHAAHAKDEAQNKGSQMMDQARNAAESCKETAQQAGQQAQDKAHEAADAVKNATGTNN